MFDPLQRRFGASAALIAEHQDLRASALAATVAQRVATRGDERALDVGTGAGALAIALAPLVAEVIAIDVVPELLAQARRRAPASVSVMHADAMALPFDDVSFDLVCTARTLHHVARPEVVLAQMERVLRPGGRMLVIDQLAPDDASCAEVVQRFEVARDASTTRLLSDGELRQLAAGHGLELLSAEIDRETRQLDDYLDRAGCHGAARERACALAPADLSAEIGWYLLRKPTGS